MNDRVTAKEGNGHQQQRESEMGSMRRHYPSTRLEAALFTGSFRMKKRARSAELGMLPSGHTVGQGPQDTYTCGHAHLGMCAAKGLQTMTMAGAGYFLYLDNERNSWSENFWKVVFRTSKLKLFG